MALFALPAELLIAIVAYLDPRDILSFRRVSYRTSYVCKRSAILRYQVALLAAGMEDTNVIRPLGSGDRLAYLSHREALWDSVDLNEKRHVSIPVNYRHSHVHDLTAGVYIFGDLSIVPDSLRTSSLRYVHLPMCVHQQSLPGKDGTDEWWKTIPIGVEALTIGLSLEENDLLAVLTSIPSPNHDAGDNHVFELHLKRFSTATYHPLAQEPIIHFHEHQDEGNHCIATIEIAGPYLLVLLAWLRSPNTSDELYIYNWTTAFLITHISSGSSTYRGASFLSNDTFILTNMRDNTIEFLKLVELQAENERTQCRWIGRLALPTLRQGCSLASISCRTDAVRGRVTGVSAASAVNGIGSPLARGRRAPVRGVPQKALVQFRMYLQGSREGHISLFTFVAHRDELLRTVHPCDSFLGTAKPTEVIARPWNLWGPRTTRWNDVNETDTAWMAGIAGQRQVFITRDRPRHIRVRNYNTKAVLTEMSRTARVASQGRVRVVTEESITAHQDCFMEDVRSALPFIEILSENTFNYDGVLMDEEHIIGLTENEEDGSIRQLDVFIITPEEPRVCECK